MPKRPDPAPEVPEVENVEEQTEPDMSQTEPVASQPETDADQTAAIVNALLASDRFRATFTEINDKLDNLQKIIRGVRNVNNEPAKATPQAQYIRRYL